MSLSTRSMQPEQPMVHACQPEQGFLESVSPPVPFLWITDFLERALSPPSLTQDKCADDLTKNRSQFIVERSGDWIETLHTSSVSPLTMLRNDSL